MAHCSIYGKRTAAGKILPDRSPSYILRPFAQSANQNSLERSHTLLLLLSQILVNYTYKFFYRNSVNHASLFQRLHLWRRSSNTVHPCTHQNLCGINIIAKQLTHKCFFRHLHEQFLLLILLYWYMESIILFFSLGKADFLQKDRKYLHFRKNMALQLWSAKKSPGNTRFPGLSHVRYYSHV